MGREKREKAGNHPVKKIYKKALNGINKRLSRGAVTDAIAAAAKRSAKDKMEQAIIDPGYALENYEKEMQIQELVLSAQREIADERRTG